ncbi:outer dynein arm-docking complex subunit 3-like [Symsagittifera roscoffensis]|uniref:outer dynein arm-docking complex subunit 3-like n=1 Tax=Symsagittifera roscoffensis TaxID=84072 RepID=UPI00307BEC42
MASKKKSKSKQDKDEIGEEIAELVAKIQLIEGDRRAFIESSDFTSKSNDAKISALRAENKELANKFRKSTTCDDETLNKVFKGHDMKKEAFKNKEPDDTIDELHNKKCDQIKKLNYAQYLTKKKDKELSDLVERMKKLHEIADRSNRRDALPTSQKSKNRMIQTDIEKYKLRNTEVDEVQNFFFKIVQSLREENKMYLTNLEDLDNQIEENEDELRGLQDLHRDAEQSKEFAKMDLQMQDQKAQGAKKIREKQKSNLKRVSDKRESELEHLEGLVQEEQRAGANHFDEDLEERKKTNWTKAEETEQRLSNIEKVNQRVKDKTGLYSNEDAINHFKSQYDTKDALESQIDKNSEDINDMRSRKQSLRDTYEELRYMDDMASNRVSVVGSEDEYSDENYDFDKARISDAERRFSQNRETQRDIRNSVDHIREKLSTAKGGQSRLKSNRPQKQSLPGRNHEVDSIAESLENVRDTIKSIYSEIGEDTDTRQVLREMEESDFNKTVQEKMTPTNTRVGPYQSATYHPSEEDDASDDDIPTRKDIKRSSQSLIDLKNSRRPNKKPMKRFR